MIKVILLSDFGRGYGRSLLKGITRYAQKNGPWAICKIPTCYLETKGAISTLKWARKWETNGIIGQFYRGTDIKKWIDAGIAVLAQDFAERHGKVPNITCDYLQTGRIGAEYFLRKGFDNFAFYGFKNTVWSRERAIGFKDRLQEEGYEVHHFNRQVNFTDDDTWYYNPIILGNWLKSLPKPIALMACDDDRAVQVTETCKLSKIKIPEEISVLGVENDEMLCDISDPPLSSISLDTEKGGYEAARLLHAMMESENQIFRDIIVEPTQVVTRHSTNIYATKDKCVGTALKFIHENIGKSIHVKDVLKQVPLSRRMLEQRFFKVTGFPIYEYIICLRIEKFAQKLLETDLTIFEIAYSLGLDDVKNISRQFRQIKGCSPSEYRKKYLIKKEG